MALSNLWERINRWGKKKAIKLEAQALWKNGMRMAPEADFLLRMAHQEGVQGRSPFTAVVLGKPNQGLHDTNHLSLFRCFALLVGMPTPSIGQSLSKRLQHQKMFWA